MSTLTPPKQSKDPCLQIQADLSAMLDGELDASSVRRVMVHSDVCESCKGFLQGIRSSAHAHRELAEILTEDAARSPKAQALRRQLVENRKQLAKILYELGKGFVFMGLSPKFSRVVAREPVPVPDMALRGRHLVDQLQRENAAGASEWVRTRDLFASGCLNTPSENLAKGKHLLREVLLLEPDSYSARIYLGHALHVEGNRDAARKEFEEVLQHAVDATTRAFALENLGNVWLEEGHPRRSIPYFLELVRSGVIRTAPRFFTSYFNLALAYGLVREFAECKQWLQRLYSEFPHKRSMILREIRARSQFAALLEAEPDVFSDFCSAFPCWFAVGTEAR